jgi:hypothetical protein
MSRKTDLLKAAAEALDDMRDPFSTDFLVEHGVTADECMDLSEWLATGARMVLDATRDLSSGSSLVRQVAADRLVRSLPR